MKAKVNCSVFSNPVLGRTCAIATTVVLAAAYLSNSSVRAQLIVDPYLDPGNPPSTNSYSSYFGPRSPEHLVDGSGCTVGPSGILGAADTTVNTDVDGAMWYSNPFLTPPDTTPWVIFDLGGLYDLQTTRIWQFNQTPYGFTVYGAADIELSFSSDGTNFTPMASDIFPNRAGGTNGEPAQDFSTAATGVRWVQLQIWTTFGGAAASGLSEVRFVVDSNTAPPIITAQPQNQTATNNETASFTVSATSLTPVGYQWRFNGTNLTNGINIAGATSSSLVLSSVSLVSQGIYDVVITNRHGPVYSSQAALVLGSPVITQQPQNAAVIVGWTANFTVAATDFGGNAANVSYQWLKNGITLTNGGNVSGVTTTNLQLSNVTTADDGGYRVLVTDTVIGKVTPSRTANLIVAPVPTVGMSFNPNPILAGNVVSYSSFYGPRSPTNLVTGADLTVGPSGIFGAADTTANNDPNLMWYSNPFLTPPDTSPWVVFDLGGTYNLETTRLWNYNSGEGGPPYGFTVYGAADIIVSLSSDNTNFTALPDIYPNRASGTNGEPAQDFSTAGTGIRYVEIHILSSFGGAQATGLSGVRFVASGNKVSISLSQGVVGLHYQIQYNTSLNPATWQVLQDIPSLGSTSVSVADPTPLPTQSRRFYRAVLLLP